MHDPIFDTSVIHSASFYGEDASSGDPMSVAYTASNDIWTLNHPARSGPQPITAEDTVNILVRHLKGNSPLPDSIADTPSPSSQDIVESLESHANRNSIRPYSEHIRYMFAWPSKSILPSHENDAVMEYQYHNKDGASEHRMFVASLHSFDEGMMRLITLYRSSRRESTGSTIVLSDSVPYNTLSRIAGHEAVRDSEHFERLKKAGEYMQLFAKNKD